LNNEKFVLMERGNQSWLWLRADGSRWTRTRCYPPGMNPFIQDYAKKFGLPFEAVFGGAPTTYPEYEPKLEQLMKGR
jgi:hypothetical protein